MIYTETAPAIRFALRERRLYFNWALLETFENPRYLQFFFENERKLFVVSGSYEEKKHSFEIPARTYFDDNDECYLSRKNLTKAFQIRMGWDIKCNYRVRGESDVNLGIVVFKLNEASVINNT